MWFSRVFCVLLCVVFIGINGAAGWQKCPDKIKGKLNSFKEMFSEPIKLKNMDPCTELEIHGIKDRLQPTDGCASRKTEGKNDAFDQRFDLEATKLTVRCFMDDGIASLAKIVNYTGTIPTIPKLPWDTRQMIEANWTKCNLKGELCVDNDSGDVEFKDASLESGPFDLSVTCSGGTTWLGLCKLVTSIPGFPNVIGFVLQLVIKSKIVPMFKEHKDILADMACED